MRDLRLRPTIKDSITSPHLRPAKRLRLLLLGSAALLPMIGHAEGLAPTTLPSGGSVAAGGASINQSGAAMTVTQTSQRAVITWQDFSIGTDAGVTFQQPGPAAAALNRVLSGIPSEVLGRLTANGQIFIVNPAGITFGQGAAVNVGGLVASTLDIANQDFMAGTYTFQRDGGTGTIANQGALTAASGGYIGLLAPEVVNDGVISAHLGNVVLAAGEKVTLSFGTGDTGAITVTVDPAAIRTLIVNHRMIAAPDGQVVLSAKSADALLGGVINNTGIIEASALSSHAGVVTLEASTAIDSGGTIAADGLEGGTGDGGTIRLKSDGAATVAGTLSAKAGSQGGDGGTVETSGASLSIADIHVDTSAPLGKTGTWLLDPSDLIVIPSGTTTASVNGGTYSGTGSAGFVSGTTVQTALATTNVTLQTGPTGSGNGDILVAGAITWAGTNSLTLNAYHDITVSADITHTAGGGAATLAFNPGQGGTGTFDVNQGAKVRLAAPGDSLSMQGLAYTLINTPAQLQAMADNLAGHYALNADLDMSGTSFTAVGDGASPFSGAFQGLGHAIANLSVGGNGYIHVGLFGDNTGLLNDVSLTAVNATGNQSVGGIVGWNAGTISNSQVTGTVSARTQWSERIGGLAGTNEGTISGSHAAVAVSGVDHSTSLGGLVGLNDGLITASYALGSVVTGDRTGGDYILPDENVHLDITPPPYPGTGIGGLAGGNTGTIIDSYTVNTVTTGNLSSNVGGLVGDNEGRIFSSFALGTVSAGMNASAVGGLVGQNGMVRLFNPHWPPPLSLPGTIIDSYSAAAVSISNPQYAAAWGGLVGENRLGAITNSYAAGGTLGTGVAGLVGSNEGLIAGSHSSDATTEASGLVNSNYSTGTIANSYATGAVNGTNALGGLAGINYGTISNSYATGAVRGTDSLGGLVADNRGLITGSHANGNVTARDDSGLVAGFDVGGLTGLNSGGTISSSYATGRVTAGDGGHALGGLAGDNGSTGTITNAFATGTVQVGNNGSSIGGLAGLNSGTVSDSYSRGTVQGLTRVGGLIGDNSGAVLNSNSWSDVITSNPPDYAGLLIGYARTGSTIANSTGYGTITTGAIVGADTVQIGGTGP